MPLASVILCTHNPAAEPLHRVLTSLCRQTMNRGDWELVVVDSGSVPGLRGGAVLISPSGPRHVRVDKPGLAQARIAGFNASTSPLIASLDDDTEMNPSYLEC